MKLLNNKIALVTGAGGGIGRAMSLALAQAGATVVVVDIDAGMGEETAHLVAKAGEQAHFLQVDVTQATEVANMVKETVARFGQLDCAINNAGIEGAPVPLVSATEADFDRIMTVNVKGVWLCMKYELEQMITQQRGSIVNMASVAGIKGAPRLPIYAGSKHAVVGLTKSAALENTRHGIRINAVCPAVIRTAMVERAVEILPQLKDNVERINPMRRLGEPEEVAAAVVWLCSDASSFTTGATLTVDGGLVA